DDDEKTVDSTFRRIIAGAKAPAGVARGARAAASRKIPSAVANERDGATPMFRRSESSLRDQRSQIDQKTMR
ncbi:MAG: hypothetical protein ABI386_09250, partial [Rhodanobacter sp.]